MAIQDDESQDLQFLIDRACSKAEEIIQRTSDILMELERLDKLHQSRRTAVAIPGQKILTNNAKTEQLAAKRMLSELRSQSFAKADDDSGRLDTLDHILEKLQCSNIFSLGTAWDLVKRCSGLEQLASKFSLHASVGPCPLCKGKKCPPKGRQSSKSIVSVDAVVNGGAEWLRIMGIDDRRLLHEMAEMGWDWSAGEDSDSEDDDDDCEISVMETVRQLVAAARANRHNYRPPRLHIVFTRIAEGGNPEIDRLIRKLRAMSQHGVEIKVDCANSEFLTVSPPSLNTALQNLVSEDLSSVTPTVNLDCSILVALASDVTHSKIEIQPWHRTDVAVQIREEAESGSSLVKALYPVLRSRRLVCTARAAQRFREIVATIATPAEAARAEIILPKGSGRSSKTSEELVAELQALSIHRVDSSLRLPIEVLESEIPDHLTADIEAKRLPRSARAVLSDLSELNRDIYLFGWLRRLTTVTANNALAKQIRLLVEEHRMDDEEAGPNIWVSPFTRALATKGRPAGLVV